MASPATSGQPEEIKRIAVVGAGTMGSGIAQVAVEAGFPVTLIDVSDDAVARGVAMIERQWTRAIEKGRATTADVEHARALLSPTASMSSVEPCDLLIEAVFENVDAKVAVYQNFAELISPTTILASNTSSISITALAAKTDLPDRFVGMHF